MDGGAETLTGDLFAPATSTKWGMGNSQQRGTLNAAQESKIQKKTLWA